MAATPYSNVPYDDWARALTGTSLSDAFRLDAQSLRPACPFRLRRAVGDPRRRGRYGVGAGSAARGAVLTVLGWVLAISCLYEIFEWMLTIVAAGETADRYNGQQGDIWDAQKDMALAALGAILVLAIPRRDRR